MAREYDGLTETLKGLQQIVLGEASAARDSSLAPAPADLGELVLTELRARRERLKRLIRMIDEEAQQEAARRAARRSRRCRPASRASLEHGVC